MLLRRLAGATVPVVLLLGATACQEQVPAQRPQTPAAAAAAMPAYWKDAPATDEQRVALLDRLRAIDPCALLPRTALARFGVVSRVENDEPDGCEAAFGSAELGEGTTVSWRTGVAPDGDGWGSSKRETVDGITVGTLGDRDSANPPGQRVDRTCTATTAFGNTATLPVIVRTPLGTEPCPIAEVPTIEVFGKDRAAVEAVLRAATELFPEE
ncbi:hypothetical protein AB0L62_01630 [Nocardia asteroides]|uniref:hypothetical protein n=1 Tax=Nocardia asteroides TaxID=1824 RepID=UPI003414644B